MTIHAAMAATATINTTTKMRVFVSSSGALMNTSMNGEPRERNLTTADLAASANKPPSSSSGRSVLEINTGEVAQIRKEEAKLAPLFTEDEAADFR